MTLEEIKAAVMAGKTVHWQNSAYTVIRDRLGQFLIQYSSGRNANWIGLTWADGVTLNGQPGDFYVAA